MTSPVSCSSLSSSSPPPSSSGIHQHDHHNARSSIIPLTVTYTWTLPCEEIKNCLYDDDVYYEYEDYLDDVKIDSPVFGGSTLSEEELDPEILDPLGESSIRFLLRLYPRSTEGCSDVGSLVLALAGGVDELRVQLLKISITGYGKTEERQIDGIARKSTSLLAQSLGWRNTFPWKEFIRNSVNLVIYCEITYLDPFYHRNSLTPTSSVNPTPLRSYHAQRLSEDFSGLLSRPSRFSDVLLVSSDGVDFPAHKAILAARSPVFDAMFSHEEVSEVTERRVVIEDISSEVMEPLLAYLYSGDTKDVGRYSVELLAAADKYDVQSLVKVCIQAMLASISGPSAARLLATADLHGLPEVKRRAMEYINRHPQEVMATEGWATYVRPRADLLEQLYADLAERELVGVTRFH